MVNGRLLDELLNQAGETQEKRVSEARDLMKSLNEKLERQLEAQTMTREMLNKTCSL
jgi:vacuolar-type H+-ATPase subunit H